MMWMRESRQESRMCTVDLMVQILHTALKLHVFFFFQRKYPLQTCCEYHSFDNFRSRVNKTLDTNPRIELQLLYQPSNLLSHISHSKISISCRTEGRTAKGIEAVDKYKCARQVLPPLGDGVPHLVQAKVELLDHISVAIPNMGSPRQQEVIGWFPHRLKGSGWGSWEVKENVFLRTKGKSLPKTYTKEVHVGTEISNPFRLNFSRSLY